MTIDQYIRDPAPAPSLSASIAHLLLSKSPRHAWLAHPRLNPQWAPEEVAHMELGTIAHAILLEGDHSRISVIDAPDWRTNDARAARDDARARGKLPILQIKMLAVERMVEAARKAMEAAPEIRDATRVDAGKPEQTIVWQDGDVWLRCRPDWLTNDGRLAIDYKTTGASAEPDAFGRGPLLSMGYDVQAGFGLRGVRATKKPRDCSFVFMVQETEPPYAVSFVGLSPEFEAFAAQKVKAAIAVWKFCVQTDTWPSYPSRVCWAEPPAWAVTRWSEAHAVSGTVDEL